MPHRSRLAGFIIDCQDTEIEPAARFWSQALGCTIADPNEDGGDRYAVLGDTPGGLHIEVQRVEHASRVHLDIESDDLDAEAARLKALGAIEVSRPHNGRWIVMQAPTGQRFCIIRMRNADVGARLNIWPSSG